MKKNSIKEMIPLQLEQGKCKHDLVNNYSRSSCQALISQTKN